ncbi:MAG: ferritin-like domain-containing protein, partial [Myxococcota bacterium]
FVDTEEIESLRAETDVAVPLQLNWNWDYGSRVAELRSLYEKGKVNQWNAETDLDWEIPCTNDFAIVGQQGSMLAMLTQMAGKDEATQKAAAFDEINYVLSQLLHGEQAALQLCGQLTNVCHEMDEKWYAASQVADEARHIEAISKFIQRKMGTIYPIGPTLKILLDELLEADTAQKKGLGMQTLFEGMAVGIMDLIRSQSTNALLSDVVRRVERDEARHAAFGVLMMRRIVRDASQSEKADMEDWSFEILEALNANQQLDMLKLLGPKYDIDPEQTTTMLTGLENFAELNCLIYMHTVVPNLKGLGLLTERTEPKWREVGMLVDKRPEVLDTLPPLD